MSLVRLQMELNDTDGSKVPLFFHTDGRGGELTAAHVQKGYTIAILYAQCHTFLYGRAGIRHEDPN
jgi:hypothetical protein